MITTTKSNCIKPGPLCTHFTGVLDFTTLRGEHDDALTYSGFTVCGYTGDDAAHIAQCRHELASSLGIETGMIVQPRQTHTSNLLFFDHAIPSDNELQDIDGLITTMRGVVVGVNTADCVPVLLYATAGTHMVAAVHAGWRGSVAKIAHKAATMMLQKGGKEIAAYIGVSICPACFEVGDEVADAFATAGMSDGIITRNCSTGKAHINLQEANRQQLICCGIQPERIFIDGCCSRHDDSGNYFSARRMGVKSGRTFTAIELI